MLTLEFQLNVTNKQIEVLKYQLNILIEETTDTFMTTYSELNATIHMLETRLEYSINQTQTQIMELDTQLNSTD